MKVIRANSVAGRLGRTFAAQGLFHAQNLASLLITLPLLIHVWGKSVYEDWCILAALPTFLTVADLGFGSALGNEIGKLYGAKQHAEAQEIYEAGWSAVVFSVLIFAVVSFLLLAFVPVQRWLQIATFTPGQTKTLIAIFVVQILVVQCLGVLKSVFRAEGLASLSVTLSACIDFMGLLCVLSIGVFHSSPFMLASLRAISLVVGGLMLWYFGRKKVPWLRPRLCRFQFARIKAMLVPGLGMNLMSLGTGFSLQGTLIAVSLAAGHQSMLIFTALRTMTRVVNQLTNVVANTFIPEFSTAIGAGDNELAKRLHHRSSQVSLWSAILGSAGMLLVAKPVFQFWSKQPFNLPLCVLLLVALIVNGAYCGSTAAPLAVNKHFAMSVFYCIASLVSVGICWIGARYFGLVGAGVGVISLEVIMLFAVIPIALRVSHDTFGDWLQATLKPDFGWIIKRALKRG